ncbi:hypothetical protein IAT38_006166 [Cryptococcus sp. DSM 104549]
MTTLAPRALPDLSTGLAHLSLNTLVDSPSSSRPASALALESERRSPPETVRDPHGTLLKFIEHLSSPAHADDEPHLMATGYELEALLSIYGDDSVRLAFTTRPPADTPTPVPAAIPRSTTPRRSDSQQWEDAVWDNEIGYTPGERIRYEVSLPVWEEGDEPEVEEGEGVVPKKAPIMRILVSLPPTYPNSSPPQLQLLGRYLGSFPIDSGLFGDITRTYISSEGAPFIAGDVCVFEGLTHVQTLARKWYADQLRITAARDAERTSHLAPPHGVDRSPADSDGEGGSGSGSDDPAYAPRPSPRPTFSYTRAAGDTPATPAMLRAEAGQGHGLEVFISDEIVDRKSVFVGRAVRVTDEREVPLVVHELLGDKRVARAAHPAIFAYRIAKDKGGAAGKVYQTDYDDDGEAQAGGRLRHLLEILDLENVLIIVTRWWGGHRLGPDRFKHISKSARDALEVGGFLEDQKKDEGKEGKGKKGKK